MLTDQVLAEIRRDLSSFADPQTRVEISSNGLMTWIRARETHQAKLLRQRSGFPEVEIDGRRYDWSGFLASEAMGDLRDLAESILTTLTDVDDFIEAPASETAQGVARRAESGVDLILSRATRSEDLPIASTRVLFVQGNAGAGKTTSLLRATRKQAERYLRGEVVTLLLYLDAQGKGLRQLEDVMARALQDLRAHFTYHSVAALTRRHCIVPIVDGFDELIGPSSAREAFANLTEFLAQLDCEGAVVTSSRSAFIDYRTLHERADEIAKRQELSYEILPIDILPWEAEQIYSYCSEVDPEGKLQKTLVSLEDTPLWNIARKPFFLSHMSRLILEGYKIDAYSDMVAQIVESTLDREAKKLRDRRGGLLLSPDQHRMFCERLGDEMWYQSRPDLDVDTIRLLAEISADEFGLTPQDAKTFIDRAPAHGLLTLPTGTDERRAFEHELFRFEFQAAGLARALVTGDGLVDYLNRAEIPVTVTERICRSRFWSGRDIASALNRVNSELRKSPRNPFSATNAGSILGALVMDEELPLSPESVIAGYYIRGQDFGKCTLSEITFASCVFEEVDFGEASIVACQMTESQLYRCKFSPFSKFDGTKIDPDNIVGIVVEESGGLSEIYDPQKIGQVLGDLGLVGFASQELDTVPAKVQARIDLAEKLLQHMRSHYYLAAKDQWVLSKLESEDEWADVQSLLWSTGLMETVRVSRGGPSPELWRLTRPPDVLVEYFPDTRPLSCGRQAA